MRDQHRFQIENLQIKHHDQIIENRKLMDNKLPLEFKHSKELLKLIVMENGLAKQKRFKEATQIQ